MEDLVSVIITSYNSNRKYLEEAIESVLQQSYTNIELIVIDDGSNNDVCHEVCKDISNPVIKYIRQENKGLPAARNTGIGLSNGKYLCFLDDDDRWHKDKILILVNNFRKIEKDDPYIGLIFSYCNLIDENGTHLGTFGHKVKGNIFKLILGKNIIGPPSSVMIKRNVLQDIGDFNETYRYAEDIELWYRLTKKYTVYSVEEALIDYRYRINSHSKNSNKMMEYAEMALLSALKENGDILSKDELKQVLSKFYKDFAFLFFSDNNSKKYKETFYKLYNVSPGSIINAKVMFGYFISLLGNKTLMYVNNFRGRTDSVPSDLTKIHNIN